MYDWHQIQEEATSIGFRNGLAASIDILRARADETSRLLFAADYLAKTVRNLGVGLTEPAELPLSTDSPAGDGDGVVTGGPAPLFPVRELDHRATTLLQVAEQIAKSAANIIEEIQTNGEVDEEELGAWARALGDLAETIVVSR
jgi:hypothetical protein